MIAVGKHNLEKKRRGGRRRRKKAGKLKESKKARETQHDDGNDEI